MVLLREGSSFRHVQCSCWYERRKDVVHYIDSLGLVSGGHKTFMGLGHQGCNLTNTLIKISPVPLAILLNVLSSRQKEMDFVHEAVTDFSQILLFCAWCEVREVPSKSKNSSINVSQKHISLFSDWIVRVDWMLLW